MGLIRKMTPVSTLGGVEYTFKREAQINAAPARASWPAPRRSWLRASKVQAEELAREHVDGVPVRRHPSHPRSCVRRHRAPQDRPPGGGRGSGPDAPRPRQ
jgi:hypothetical protein